MNKVKKNEWFAWEWPGFYWYQGIHPGLAWFYDFKKYNCGLREVVLTFSKGTEAYYFLRDDYTQKGGKFFKLVKNNPKIIFSMLKKIDQSANEIFGLEKKWEKIDFTKLSKKQLLKYHGTLFYLDEALWRNGQIPNLLELSNSLLTDYVKGLIAKKFDEKSLNEIFSILTTSRYESKTERQENDFSKILLSKNLSENKMKSHWKKYTWMTYGWSGPALSYNHFLNDFTSAKKNKQIIKNIEIKSNNKRQILFRQKQITTKFSNSEQMLINMLREILESKAKRVDAHSLTYFFADKLLLEIGKRVGLSLNQMRVVIPSDVPKLFSNLDVNKINQEYDRVLIWFKNGKAKKYTGKIAEQKLNFISKHLPKIPRVKALNGELAYPGKIKGVARVILDIKDSYKFKKGEILITRMTDPNYLQIMKLSKAIITDIGGITCHAAIVSRELQKPCLVGTKFATKVFKDGDIIEVDANKGIIRKIK